MAATPWDGSELRIDTVHVPARSTWAQDAKSGLMVVEVISGAITVSRAGESLSASEGEVILPALPGDPHIGRAHKQPCVLVITDLPFLTLIQTAARVALVGQAPIRFTGQALREDVPAAHWRRARTFAQELVEDPAASPAVLAAAGRLLAATALASFPNSTMSEASTPTEGSTETLRRAIEFIRDDRNEDFSIADVARAAGVTPRAVQLAFRKHLDATPLSYAREVRLQRAHQELLAAGPGHDATVADIARRSGFASPSRFAAQYHRVYGCYPNETLALPSRVRITGRQLALTPKVG